MGGVSVPLALIPVGHEAVQEAKEKRPWIERVEPGFVARPPYYTSDEPPIEGEYIHPYRVEAISSFIRDLGKAR